MSEWEVKVPKSIVRLRQLAQWYEVSTDYIVLLTDNPTPRPKHDLSPDERSILDIMRNLPASRREEVIRLAEVVLAIHHKEEKEESELSTFDRINKKYESGDDGPRIIGDDSQGY